MGLLSDPVTRKKFVGLLLRNNTKLCALSYVAGVAWFLALAYEPLNARTYVSENALLPGLVDGHYSDGGDAIAIARELAAHKAERDGMPVEWLVRALEQRGLEVHTQTFSRVLPFPDELRERYMVRGTNVYGIVRAPRAASTEALVFTVAFQPGEHNNQATGLALSLAAHFRRQVYWAKDIIFLFNEHDQIGMQAWLEAYHDTNLTGISSSVMRGRAGSIQAALTLEMSSDVLTSLDLHLEGLNGQLPNLDLVNLVHVICGKKDMLCTIQGQLMHQDGESWEGYVQSLRTVMLMALNQASSRPTGDHSLFLRYRIEALTLRGINSLRSRKIGATTVGGLLEGIFRSLNNLLERFHQSFFFYLLPCLHRYISIGHYMPAFGFIILAPMLKMVELWIQLGQEEEGSNGTARRAEPAESQSVLLFLAAPITICHATGLALLYLPTLAQHEAADYFGVSETEAVTFTTLAIYLAGMALPHQTHRVLLGSGTRRGWMTLKCVTLMYLSVLLASIALINFSLGFLLAVAMVPIATFITPSRRWLLQVALLLLASPAVLLLVALALRWELLEVPWQPLDAWLALLQALAEAVLDHQLYGALAFPLAALAVYPCWLMLWNVLFWTC
ncbi:LOW QUALITY PROTEIN: glycosylphosphatidylinositol anchor attachment 1 protein [Lethenteron reissneri]|uniref:LOW QUALITY PROTEIN: glycosylphosphatidylinositol anchor attachment 1 protein n=1 Tax=Lethenteron reissneri TaxID=7753 RepID=UPI002AB6FF44|nr:LOW QUALITY PROTEIN: glycosylphosphatidylinositol anchor attachment 1 protein [Lethenteron reissneri]